jgi:hypothetical protein
MFLHPYKYGLFIHLLPPILSRANLPAFRKSKKEWSTLISCAGWEDKAQMIFKMAICRQYFGLSVF